MERIEEKYKELLARFEEQRKNIRRLWNIDKSVGKFLYRLVEIAQPKNILELGTSNGYSTFWLSIASNKYGGAVTTIEVDKTRYELAKGNLESLKNINLINELIETAIPKLQGKFDMIFIDANKSDYIKYIHLLLEHDKLQDYTLIVADNILSHKDSVEEYVSFVTSDKRFNTEIEEIGTGMALTVYEKY